MSADGSRAATTLTLGAPLCAPEDWASRRRAIEAGRLRHTPDGARRAWVSSTDLAVPVLHVALRLFGLYRRAVRNALAVELNTVTLSLPRLPAAFDGYRILQLSDLHLDIHPELGGRALALLSGVEADLVLYTGDYCNRRFGDAMDGLDRLAPLSRAVRGIDGSFAILGNHDPTDTAERLAAMGLEVLINRHVTLRRGDAELHLTGLDDVHHFYTEDAARALRATPDGFRIAIVHSPEMADFAAAAGCDLYLCGHTHGGQICLSSGRPLVTAVYRCKTFSSGQWRCGDMLGFTSRGVGSSGLPARFNCPPEANLLVLQRS